MYFLTDIKGKYYLCICCSIPIFRSLRNQKSVSHIKVEKSTVNCDTPSQWDYTCNQVTSIMFFHVAGITECHQN